MSLRLNLYIFFNVLKTFCVADNPKNSILVITNKIGFSQYKALYKNAFTSSTLVSSLQNNKVFTIGKFPVRLRYK